jgi:integrase
MATRHKLGIFLRPRRLRSRCWSGDAHVGEGDHRSYRYNPGMTITPAISPAADQPELTDGLTAEDAARVAAASGAASGAARTTSTRRVYGHAWRQWERWCASRGLPALPGGLPALPGDPAAVCAYLAERAAAGTTVATLNVACSAIGHVHRSHGVDDPIAHPSVRQVRMGLRRTYGIAPRRQARPLSVAELRQILAHIDRTWPIGIRDTAILLLGYAGALRRSELTDVLLADVEHKTAGLLLTLRKSKTDQEGHGQVIGIAHGSHLATDPIAALDAWLALRGHEPGPLFTRVYASRIHAEPLSGNTITRMLTARAGAAGLPAERITAHSLRAGHATTAALAGVPLERIAAQTRQRDLSVLVERYIRPLEALAHTSSRDLGL